MAENICVWRLLNENIINKWRESGVNGYINVIFWPAG